MNLQELKQEYQQCKKCPSLCTSRTQVVFGSGNQDSKILFIGEAPGANEDKQGIPFCGMSGQILNELLQSVNLKRENIFITNTILCRPESNRNPSTEEVKNCSERLDKLIHILQPKVIVTIGNFATDRIIKKKGITSIHGKVFSFNNIPVVPVIHPANLLYQGRNPILFESMKKDFQIIAQIVQENKKQKGLSDY
ncbi:uracil-DNA glycosylase [Candidatus Woesearchaeota archaeon]|nr:uracil-DNA glycosylase [Candidatus Woesearchaeota archaeon]